MLAVMSSSAMAEWVEVSKSGEKTEETNFITVYADPDTIQKIGNKAKMWVLIDYKKIDKGFGAKSVKHKEGGTCKSHLLS